MSKWTTPKPTEAPTPTRYDYDNLRAGMAKFALKRIGGKLHGAFEQYCASRSAITFSEDGTIQVFNPLDYHRLCDMKAKMDSLDFKVFKEELAKNPEKKAAFVDLVKKWSQQIKQLIHEKQL